VNGVQVTLAGAEWAGPAAEAKLCLPALGAACLNHGAVAFAAVVPCVGRPLQSELTCAGKHPQLRAEPFIIARQYK